MRTALADMHKLLLLIEVSGGKPVIPGDIPSHYIDWVMSEHRHLHGRNGSKNVRTPSIIHLPNGNRDDNQ